MPSPHELSVSPVASVAAPSRTRLPPLGGAGKSFYFLVGFTGLLIIGALLAHFYAKGGDVQIATNAPNASVVLDSTFAQTDRSGFARFQRFPYGRRSLQVTHPEYEPLSTTLNRGWLSSNSFSFHLNPIPLTLQINTRPGATISLNNQTVGTADTDGVFQKQGIMPGDYDIKVDLSGYTPFHLAEHLSPKFARVYAFLRPTAERVRAEQEQQQQLAANAAQVQELLAAARREFTSRQYGSALASVNDALHLEPNNTQAQQLKDQIVQTMNILK
jgi:hypothetical protein